MQSLKYQILFCQNEEFPVSVQFEVGWHFLHLVGVVGGISYIASVGRHFGNKMKLNPC